MMALQQTQTPVNQTTAGRWKTPGKKSPRKGGGSSSDRYDQMKSVPRDQKTRVSKKSQQMKKEKKKRQLTPRNTEINFIIPLGSNINSIHKAKAIIINLVQIKLYFTYIGRTEVNIGEENITTISIY